MSIHPAELSQLEEAQRDKATPRPWTLGRDHWPHNKLVDIEASGRTICTAIDADHAALIVRAVNSHDELVALLTRALKYVEHSEVSVVIKVVAEIRAVLAKAAP